MRSEKRKKDLGEVFTPIPLVNEVLDRLPDSLWNDPEKTWMDPSCGNGNFLVEVKRRLMEGVLERIFGVDIMEDNIQECKDRLDHDKQFRHIIDKNIVCADSLRYHYRFDGSPLYDKTEKEKFDEHASKILDGITPSEYKQDDIDEETKEEKIKDTVQSSPFFGK